MNRVSELPLHLLRRGRNFFRTELPLWLEDKTLSLPSYRTPLIAVIANVNVRYVHELTQLVVLTISIALMIASGTILGMEEGANYVNIKTKGWAKDINDDEYRVFDAFDLRVPQIENGAIFLSTYMHRSPVQIRYDGSEGVAAHCRGSHQSEQCTTGEDCVRGRLTHNGFMSGANCMDGYCYVHAWCNHYKHFCSTTQQILSSAYECDINCPFCFPALLNATSGCGSVPVLNDNNRNNQAIKYFCEPFQTEDGSTNQYRVCYNKNATALDADEQFMRCLPSFLSTNPSLMEEEQKLVMDGLQDWSIEFDIFMSFAKYWMSRSIAGEYYEDVNVWTIAQILAKVGVTYHEIKYTGILLAANANIQCTLFSSFCKVKWQFSRLDGNGEGFGLTHKEYVPGISVLGQSIKTLESRYIVKMRGIRLVTSISSKTYVPDPMAALVAVGGVIGVCGVSTIVAKLFMDRVSEKKEMYQQFSETTYEQLVKSEKDQLKLAFEIAVKQHMQILYDQEKQIKQVLNEAAADDDSDRF